MPQVQLDDQVFRVAQRRAAEGGYASVGACIADIVVHETGDEADNLDYLFTPERIAELESISAEIKAGGKTYTMAEVREHFENRRNIKEKDISRRATAF